MGYQTGDDNLKPGLVVAIDTSRGDDTWVTIANRDSSKNIVGIVTTIEDSFIAITSSQRKLYVENEGEVETYVSDINGEVRAGDLLTLSPVSGVLMKALPTDAAIGLSLENLNDKTTETYQLNSSQNIQETKLRRLKINFNLKAFQGAQTGTDSTLKRLGRAIVGKEIGELRLVVATLILLVVLIVEGSIIYGAVSSSLTALGRNPMAKTVIKRELLRVFVVTLFVLILGVSAIYAILWV